MKTFEEALNTIVDEAYEDLDHTLNDALVESHEEAYA